MRKILLIAFLVRFIFLFGGYHPDLGNHLDWGIRFWQYGPRKFYDASVWSVSWPNQPPGTIYLWAVIAKFKEILWTVLWWVNINIRLFPSNLVTFLENRLHPALVKLPSVLSEIGIGWLIYLIVLKLKNEKSARWASLIFLFNPITIYNSAVWGQTDGLISFFGLLAVYLLLTKKPILGMLSFFLSLYFKASLAIFAPIIFILLLKEKYSFKKIIFAIVVPVLVADVLSLPFAGSFSVVFGWLADLYFHKVFPRQGNMLTGNAFNLWALLFGIDYSRTDQGQFLAFNFRQWGQGIFLLLNLPVIWALISRKIKWNEVFLALAIVSFSAFLFLTNMHERYLYPLFPYLAILVGISPKIIGLFGMISAIHFLNLYHLWFYPRIGILVNMLLWQGAVLVRLLSFFLMALYAYIFLIFLRGFKGGKIRTR